jgi:hypothetical protein
MRDCLKDRARGVSKICTMNHRIAVAAACAALVLASPAFADDKGLPAEQVIAAIQAAVAAQPGQVKDVEVKDRRNQASIVEVEIVAADGRTHKVRIDAATRQVVR